MSPGIPSTLSGADFNSVFLEVQHQHTMGLRNGEVLRLFHLNVRNNQFTYTNLEQFVRHNAGQYVFSRANTADYLTANNQLSVGLDASQTLTRVLTLDNNVLGEILLCAFLEEALGTPEVLSKVELTGLGGGVQSQADAIHLQPSSKGRPAANLVFGTSNVHWDLGDVIDRVVVIQSNSAVECQIDEATVFTQQFDTVVTTTLREMLIPKPGGRPQYDTAYSLFPAYDVGLAPTNYSTAQYGQVLATKMQTDTSFRVISRR